MVEDVFFFQSEFGFANNLSFRNQQPRKWYKYMYAKKKLVTFSLTIGRVRYHQSCAWPGGLPHLTRQIYFDYSQITSHP